MEIINKKWENEKIKSNNFYIRLVGLRIFMLLVAILYNPNSASIVPRLCFKIDGKMFGTTKYICKELYSGNLIFTTVVEQAIKLNIN